MKKLFKITFLRQKVIKMIMNIFPSFKNRVDTPSRVKSFSTEKRKFVFYRPKIEKKKKEKNSNYRSDYTAERKQLVQRLWSHAIRENNFPNGGRGKKSFVRYVIRHVTSKRRSRLHVAKTKTYTHPFSPIRPLMRFVLCCGAKFTRKDLFRDAVCNSNLLNYNIVLIHEKGI